MQALVVGVLAHVKPNLLRQIEKIAVHKAMGIGVFCDLLLVRGHPLGIQAGSLHENQGNPLLLAGLPDPLQIREIFLRKAVVLPPPLCGKFPRRPHISPQIIALKGGQRLFAEGIEKVLRPKAAPPGMIPQNGKKVLRHLLPLHGVLPDRLPFVPAPGHAVKGHPVVLLRVLALRHHCLNIDKNHLRSLPLQGIHEHVVGLGNELVGIAPDIARDPVLLPQRHGGNALVGLAVPQNQQIMGCLIPVIFFCKIALNHGSQILRHKHPLGAPGRSQKNQKTDEGCQPWPANSLFHGPALPAYGDGG